MSGILNVMLADNAAAAATTTWNPSDKDAGTTLSNGNLTATGTADAVSGVRGAASSSNGLKFWKITLVTNNGLTPRIGVGDSSAPLNTFQLGSDVHSVVIAPNGTVSGAGSGGGDPYAAGDDIYQAVNLSANLYWYKVGISGFWLASGSDNPATATGGIDISGRAAGAFFPIVASGRFGSSGTFDVFTADFSGSGAPSGFGAW